MCNGKLKIKKLMINTGKERGKHRKLFLLRCMAVCGIVCMLCGCTRREQLVLETADTQAQQIQVSEQEPSDGLNRAVQGQGQSEDVRQGNQEQSVSGTAEAGAGEQSPAQTGTASQIAQQDRENATICVHVCGAVKNAGVYELPAGSRVYEAVKEAGGFAEDADESYVNQAQQLTDGSKLVIPTADQVRNEPKDGSAGTEQIGIVEQAAVSDSGDGTNAGSDSGTQEDGRVNINTASEAQLCGIPGIGATRAAAIMAYRQEHGGFKSIEEIMNVSGIKEGTYAKIKDSIKVN